MKPSLSCKPNQRVERRGARFLFVIFFAFLELHMRQWTPRHFTTLGRERAFSRRGSLTLRNRLRFGRAIGTWVRRGKVHSGFRIAQHRLPAAHGRRIFFSHLKLVSPSPKLL